MHDGQAPAKATKYILRTDILHERGPVSKALVTEPFAKGQEFGVWQRHYEPSCLNYTE